MNKTGLVLLFTLSIFVVTSAVSFAQFRDQVNRGDFSGPVVQQQRPEPGNWSNLFNMKMSHSYSMTFSSFGGQYRNVNAYTNSMDFFFTDRLTGELDISLMHSPFGQGFSNTNNQLGANIVIRNAELNYQISDKSNISIQFQQHPYSPYYSPFGGGPFDYYGYNRY
ncbi:hypothetical protein NC796_23345 [Aliifodinibius sp. S!AR15-10]|uniref:hypothetical protein n=1 Tax=Aliifodinibius sp. S!AR15-10 TaxID=2950437 RepID=UPI00285E8BA2|nr:hypothetical protein [Aliifodinibius sp. S!AR15-10]MDR8394103.1 hypothetical protein [Aliifodinibius sp. S!AR15-10]